MADRETPGFRLRVFGWSETWRVAPTRTEQGWSLHILLAPDSVPGRAVPPFLQQTEWTGTDLVQVLALAKDEIRRDAEALRKRAFIVDETAD